MPRTLAQNAQYINNTIKPAIKSAIEAQGVTVPSTDSFLDYADRIGEIEGGGSGYQLKDLPTGSIATVTDAAELPLNALKVSVEAWQEGSGDPSPSNIRPIHGWDSGEIMDYGKNFINFDFTTEPTKIGTVDFAYSGSTFTLSGTETDRNYIMLATKEKIPLKKGTTYTLSIDITGTYDAMLVGVYVYNSSTRVDRFRVSQTNRKVTQVFNSDYESTAIVIEGLANNGVYDCKVKCQLEIGETNTAFEPYNPNSKTITQQFPQTIYGGEWDVVSGELGLKITDGFYESYNGETLPSVWMSDRDVYQEGTTPTIGAQVKYRLATPTYVTLTGLSIRLNEGTNNLYADCGEVIEGEYFVGSSGAYDLYDYIESDGTQYINTGRKLSNGDLIRCLYMPQSGNSNWNYVWASYDSNTVKGGLVFISSSIKAQYINGSETNRESYSDGTFYEDTLTMTADSNGDTYVFSYSADTACCSYMRLYAFSINGDDFLPCKRRSDGVFGLYDVANSQFLTDSASGNAFIGGNNLGVRIG